MPFHLSRRLRRAALAPAALMAGLIAGPLMPHGASAAISYCRTDPIVYLNNGMKLDVTAQFAGSPSDVSSIVYTVHVPAGASVNHVVFTRGWLGHAESLQVYADNGAGAYATDTVVNTHTPGAQADATTTLLDQTNSAKDSGTASGTTGQHLPVKLTTPTAGSDSSVIEPPGVSGG